MLFAQFASFAAFVAISMMQATPAGAVCASGQLAVGTETFFELEGENEVSFFSGFLMANDCGTIAVNGLTEDRFQLCDGGYDDGASVTCSNNVPVSAVDTQGNHWTCSPTSDTSCNVNSPFGAVNVVVCCNRD